jgi:hypothetical protein
MARRIYQSGAVPFHWCIAFMDQYCTYAARSTWVPARSCMQVREIPYVHDRIRWSRPFLASLLIGTVRTSYWSDDLVCRYSPSRRHTLLHLFSADLLLPKKYGTLIYTIDLFRQKKKKNGSTNRNKTNRICICACCMYMDDSEGCGST